MKKLAIFLFGFILFFTISFPIQAQVYQDYRSDYRSIPSYSKTVQYFAGRNNNRTTFYFRHNLGFSADPQAFVIPFTGEDAQVDVVTDEDPINKLLDTYEIAFSYALKKVDYKVTPKFFNSTSKNELYESLITNGIDITESQKSQIDGWLENSTSLLLLITNPVSESRVTWTTPVKVSLTQDEFSLPMGWLRTDFGALTTNQGKIIYAENFEGGNSGWQDEYQGAQANSLVTRDNSEAYQGDYSVKVANKPGSINALSTKTIGGLIPNEHYTFSAYVKNGTTTSGDATLRVMGGGLVALASGVPLYNNQGYDWQRINVTFQARSSFHYFTLMSHGEGGQYVYWDNIQIEKGTQATDFRNDQVGTTIDTSVRDDLLTTQVDLQILVLGNAPFNSPSPLILSTVYKFNDKNFKQFLPITEGYLTQLKGIINPGEVSQFLTINTADDPNLVKIETLLPRKSEDKAIIGLKDYLEKRFLLFLIIGIALLLKYGFTLAWKIRTTDEKLILPIFLYCGSWFVNFMGLLFLVSSFYTEAVRIPHYLDFSSSYQLFLISIFFTSFIVYIPSLLFTRKSNTKTIKYVLEGQMGISLIIFITVVSLLMADLLKTTPDITLKIMTTNVDKYSKIPALLITIIESIVLFISLIRYKNRKLSS